MSRDLGVLTLETRMKAEHLKELQPDTLIYCTVRTAEQQAIYYRQSRSWMQIQNKEASLRDRGLDFLANALLAVGPRHGRHVTNAGPGESYHQYGLAFDIVPMVDGACVWNNNFLWDQIGFACKEVDLEWGGFWSNFVDKPHCQNMGGGNPLRLWTAEEVKERCILT